MISQFEIASGQAIGDDDAARADLSDPFEYPLVARLTTVDEAVAMERTASGTPAAVLTIPVDDLLSRVGGLAGEPKAG